MMGPALTWRMTLEVDGPDGVVAVAVSPDAEVLGFASGGPARDADGPTEWELYTVNVVASAYGSGLSHDLVAAVTRQRPATVWVLRENSRARGFYAKEGYVADGAMRTHEGKGLPELRMVRH